MNTSAALRSNNTSRFSASQGNTRSHQQVRPHTASGTSIFEQFKQLLRGTYSTLVPSPNMPVGNSNEPETTLGQSVKSAVKKVAGDSEIAQNVANVAGKAVESAGTAATMAAAAGLGIGALTMAKKAFSRSAPTVAQAAQKVADTVCMPEAAQSVSSGNILGSMGSSVLAFGKKAVSVKAGDFLANGAGEAAGYLYDKLNDKTENVDKAKVSNAVSTAIKYAHRGYIVGGCIGAPVLGALAGGVLGGALGGYSATQNAQTDANEGTDGDTSAVQNPITGVLNKFADYQSESYTRETATGLAGIVGGLATAAASYFVTSSPIAQGAMALAGTAFAGGYVYDKFHQENSDTEPTTATNDNTTDQQTEDAGINAGNTGEETAREANTGEETAREASTEEEAKKEDEDKFYDTLPIPLEYEILQAQYKYTQQQNVNSFNDKYLIAKAYRSHAPYAFGTWLNNIILAGVSQKSPNKTLVDHVFKGMGIDDENERDEILKAAIWQGKKTDDEIEIILKDKYSETDFSMSEQLANHYVEHIKSKEVSSGSWSSVISNPIQAISEYTNKATTMAKVSVGVGALASATSIMNNISRMPMPLQLITWPVLAYGAYNAYKSFYPDTTQRPAT